MTPSDDIIGLWIFAKDDGVLVDKGQFGWRYTPRSFSWDQIEFFWDNKQLRVRFDRDNTTGDWDIQLILEVGILRITDTLEIYPMVSGQRGLPGESAVIDMTVIAPIIEDILAVAPTWNTIPDQTFTVGTVASVDVSDYVATGEVITYSATGLPSGLSINSLTGVISGTPDTSGMETVTVTASNAGGSGRDNV